VVEQRAAWTAFDLLTVFEGEASNAYVVAAAI
jgi:hypothetical protein